MSSCKTTKIFLNRHHFACVNTRLLQTFQAACGVVNYAAWVRQIVFVRYGVRINDAEDIRQVQKLIEDDMFDSNGEWLNTQMRVALRLSSHSTVETECTGTE